jgi:dihydroxy-acid dehydratase
MDAVVVIGGCDKTAAGADHGGAVSRLPTVVIPVGPMVVGHHKGEVLGACTDCRRCGAASRRRDRRGRDRDVNAVSRRRSAPAW